MSADVLDMEELTKIVFGHAAFQYLNAGSELGLFDLLNKTPHLTSDELGKKLDLEDRAIDTLLLGTTSLKLTLRDDEGRYRNAGAVEQLFTDGKWDIIQAVIGFEAHIVYEGQADFVESLRTDTNVGLRRIPGTAGDLYRRLNDNPFLQRVFYTYMRSWSELANPLLIEKVDFNSVTTVLDAGGGDGVNAIDLARAYPHLKITVLEIEDTVPIARKRVADNGLEDRIDVRPGDIFEPYPSGYDCVLFSHQFVIWTDQENIQLLKNAHAALKPGGRVVVFNSISDDSGDGPLMAALDSVYFTSLPAQGGMIYPWKSYVSWLAEAGFTETELIPCRAWTPHGIAMGTKRAE
ncbi:ubiquinone/menaquinone biosynthesis C-methylase UbiE [Streptomyces griseochromogenes]|uniref:Methyltransferase n=1 Tax=Streptomyces griseochromogenes TaxID=68214 RepID=A0A1B1AW67_9ACTN|nr:methyltransferase [Streptomyces griseochromogenes]ANP50838.1 methyltransferase [Streptomyces griseochromogenes]MBP2056685.1 ubiquinone/menaquinone biosynthesis C-methylase UbiE [Streptomyces griseochromogenes]